MYGYTHTHTHTHIYKCNCPQLQESDGHLIGWLRVDHNRSSAKSMRRIKYAQLNKETTDTNVKV